VAVALTTSERVVVQGTNRSGKAVTVVIEGDELEKHRLRRARKGSLVGRRIRPTALGPETAGG
jgi:hypothetical protein